MPALYMVFAVFVVGVSASFDLTCPAESPCCADSFSNSELIESVNVKYGTATDLNDNAVVDLFMDAYEVCPFPCFVFQKVSDAKGSSRPRSAGSRSR